MGHSKIACSTAIGCNSPLETALADIQSLGFQYVDLLVIDGWVHVNTRGLVQDFEGEKNKLDRLFAQYALTPLYLNTGVSQQLHQRSSVDNAQRRLEIDGLIRLMRAYDIHVAAIQPRNNDPSRLWEAVLQDSAATLKEQVETGRAAGVTFALELHSNSPFESLAQARRLLEVFPDVPLVYDPSHYVMQGIDLTETYFVMERACHVHLRDAALHQMQAPFGRGQIDFDRLLKALLDQGYQGGFSIEYLEQEQAGLNILDDVARMRDKIKQYFP